MNSTFDYLREKYLSQMDINNVKSADVIRRGKYWFVDVELITGEKLTRLRFDTKEFADLFFDYLSLYAPEMAGKGNAWTLISTGVIVAALVVGFLIYFFA